MASWTQTEWTPGQRAWQRSLGVTEGCFYWDSVLNGTTDTVVHVHLRAKQPGDTHIHSRANVRRAWTSVKRRFPLLAAQVHEDGHDARFVVCEQDVVSLREDDVTFGTVSSFHAADQFVTDILDGSPPLSPKLLARVYMLWRTDRPHHFHVVLVVAHCITDGCSTSTILRTFFQTLASSYDPAPLSIPTRLHMCLSLESRLRFKGVSLSRRRWRMAIGYALHVGRLARFQGGHTMPATVTSATPLTPATSRIQLFTFSRALSDVILSNCRHYGITLACASYALSQVVLSRVLCRRYLKGDISEQEWAYRTREPMFFNGPLNLRPYLDSDWFQHGGSGEVGLNASFAQYMLPCMSLGVMRSEDDVRDLELVDGAPHFPELMSFERFPHRCHVVKTRVEKLFNHPRFVDMCTAGYRFRLPLRQDAAHAWRAAGKHVTEPESPLAPIPVPSLGPIMTQDGSSMGNMDTMMPLDYPLPATHPLSPLSQHAHPHRAGYPVQPVPPSAVQDNGDDDDAAHGCTWTIGGHMRLRPEELYLGSWSVRGQLQFFVFYDARVFGAEGVEEWLGELWEAVRWYLGEPRGGAQGRRAEPAAKL